MNEPLDSGIKAHDIRALRFPCMIQLSGLSLEIIIHVLGCIDQVASLLKLRLLNRFFNSVVVSNESVLAAAIISRLPDHHVYAMKCMKPQDPILRYRYTNRLVSITKSIETIMSHSFIAKSMYPGLAEKLYAVGEELLLFSKCEALPRRINASQDIDDPDGEMFRLISHAMKITFTTFKDYTWTSMDIATIFLEGPELWARILGGEINEDELRQELGKSRGSIRGIRAIRSIWPYLGFQTVFEIVGVAAAELESTLCNYNEIGYRGHSR